MSAYDSMQGFSDLLYPSYSVKEEGGLPRIDVLTLEGAPELFVKED